MTISKKYKISDRIILMVLSGSVSAAIANTFGYFTKSIYKPTVVMPEAAANLFIPSDQIHTVLGFVFANLMSFTVGGLHAVVYVIMLDLTGWRHFWLKSAANTTMGWFLVVGVIFRALGVGKADLLSSVLFYGAHLVYLTVSAYIVSTYGVPRDELDTKGRSSNSKSFHVFHAPARKIKNETKKVKLEKPIKIK
jgi:hypothetical protein